MRVFLDTNVIVAAFATRGLCADVFRVILAEHDLVTADPVLREVDAVLAKKIGLPRTTINEVLTLLKKYRVAAKGQLPLAISIRDPNDRPIVAAAIAANADVLVTGDHDILAERDRLPLKVADPRGFWEIAKQKSR